MYELYPFLLDSLVPVRLQLFCDFHRTASLYGFRRFYAHLLAMNQIPPKQTLFFEEPEKGIYPGGLEVLTKELQNCAERGQSQVILTTQSPALLDHFEPESIRVVDIEANATKIGRVEREQVESVKRELLTTGELLTVDPARVETSGD